MADAWSVTRTAWKHTAFHRNIRTNGSNTSAQSVFFLVPVALLVQECPTKREETISQSPTRNIRMKNETILNQKGHNMKQKTNQFGGIAERLKTFLYRF